MQRDPILEQLDDVAFGIVIPPRLVLDHGLEAAYVLAALRRWITGMMPISLGLEDGRRGELTIDMSATQAEHYLGCTPPDFGVLLARMNAVGLPVFDIEANTVRLRFTIHDPDDLLADQRSKQLASVGVRS